ncbi:hypothetical protein CHS0354_025185 [Potamilus streckersoni]|uniref:VPS37 C-terminal domain-containing protein n=1 Tax=Potamilus streckersoni TaxID=2493646 RepID=A0AAE0RN22_9BIVA|nr:hypothetical protein CHS0354_025185 [Potamilus streckersoni]
MPWFGMKKSSLPPATNLQAQKIKQIETLRGGSLQVAETIRDVEYRVVFQIAGSNLTLVVSLPPQFPQDKPTVTVEPRVIHPWVDQQGKVIGCANLNNFSIHSSLLVAIQAIIDEFKTNPPSLSSHVYPASQQYPSPIVQPPYLYGPQSPPFSMLGAMPTLPLSSHSNEQPITATSQTKSAVTTRSGVELSVPDVFTAFPQLKTMSNTELLEILNEEEKILEMIQSMPRVHQIAEEREAMSFKCTDLAKENLSKKPILQELRQAVTDSYGEFERLKSLFELIQERHLCLLDQFHPTALHNNLKVAIMEVEEESEKLVDDFLEKRIDLEEFTTKFLEKRALWHARRAKEEKLNQISMNQGQSSQSHEREQEVCNQEMEKSVAEKGSNPKCEGQFYADEQQQCTTLLPTDLSQSSLDSTQLSPHSPRDSTQQSPHSPTDSTQQSPHSPKDSTQQSPYSPRDSTQQSPRSPRESTQQSPHSPRELTEKKKVDGPFTSFISPLEHSPSVKQCSSHDQPQQHNLIRLSTFNFPTGILQTDMTSNQTPISSEEHTHNKRMYPILDHLKFPSYTSTNLSNGFSDIYSYISSRSGSKSPIITSPKKSPTLLSKDQAASEDRTGKSSLDISLKFWQNYKNRTGKRKSEEDEENFKKRRLEGLDPFASNDGFQENISMEHQKSALEGIDGIFQITSNKSLDTIHNFPDITNKLEMLKAEHETIFQEASDIFKICVLEQPKLTTLDLVRKWSSSSLKEINSHFLSGNGKALINIGIQENQDGGELSQKDNEVQRIIWCTSGDNQMETSSLGDIFPRYEKETVKANTESTTGYGTDSQIQTAFSHNTQSGIGYDQGEAKQQFDDELNCQQMKMKTNIQPADSSGCNQMEIDTEHGDGSICEKDQIRMDPQSEIQLITQPVNTKMNQQTGTGLSSRILSTIEGSRLDLAPCIQTVFVHGQVTDNLVLNVGILKDISQDQSLPKQMMEVYEQGIPQMQENESNDSNSTDKQAESSSSCRHVNKPYLHKDRQTDQETDKSQESCWIRDSLETRPRAEFKCTPTYTHNNEEDRSQNLHFSFESKTVQQTTDITTFQPAFVRTCEDSYGTLAKDPFQNQSSENVDLIPKTDLNQCEPQNNKSPTLCQVHNTIMSMTELFQQSHAQIHKQLNEVMQKQREMADCLQKQEETLKQVSKALHKFQQSSIGVQTEQHT